MVCYLWFPPTWQKLFPEKKETNLSTSKQTLLSSNNTNFSNLVQSTVF